MTVFPLTVPRHPSSFPSPLESVAPSDHPLGDRKRSHHTSILVCQSSGLDSIKGFAYQHCPTFGYCDMMLSPIKFTWENWTIELPKK